MKISFFKKRPYLKVLAGISALCLMLSGCSPEEKTINTAPLKYGGVLYFGVETPFYGFDVLGSGGGGILLPDMAILNSCIQESLFRMDSSGNLTPVLGLSASPSADGRSWTIQLRENVRFHDGTIFSADAVVHHWARMLDPKNAFRGRKLFQPIRVVEKVDVYTVRFLLDHPWPSFLKVISDEQYLFSFIPSPAAVAAGTHNEHPVGTGPFKFHSWNRDDHCAVVKNTDYWQEKKPYLNRIVFRTVPDHQTRFASLVSGELDAIVIDRGNLVRKAESDAALYVHQIKGNGAEIVMLNTAVAPLNDIRVRRALALANHQKMHVKLVYGSAIPIVHHPFGDKLQCPDNAYPEHDLEEARRLIAEYGKSIELECLHSNTLRGRQTGELLQQLFKNIGVTLKPVGLSAGPVIMRVMKRDYQLTTWRILPSNDLGPQLYRSLHSQSATNYSGYQNPVMDKLLEAQRVEMDPKKRDAILCEIATRINLDVPFFYRGGRRVYILSRKKIRDLVEISESSFNLATAWMDEGVKINEKAYEIEQQSKSPEIDCPDPGDVEAVKAIIMGTWEGKDDWGKTIQFTFDSEGRVTGRREGSATRKGKYAICQNKILFSGGGTNIIISVSKEKLVGQWEKTGYTGNFTLTKKPS